MLSNIYPLLKLSKYVQMALPRTFRNRAPTPARMPNKPDTVDRGRNNNMLSLTDYRWRKTCGGLVQLPIAA